MPELFHLDSFLRSGHSGESAMSLSAAHGSLTAVASGPDAFEPGEWIRLIFDRYWHTD
jgi:yecA family protein